MEKKVVNEGSQWVKDEIRCRQKEHLKQGDEQNKFIYYNETNIDTLKISLILLIK